MPKKTRREKLLAEAHRKIHESSHPHVIVSTGKATQTLATIPSYLFPTQSALVQRDGVDVNTVQFRAIKMDLGKTIVLAAIAIVVELMVYWKMGR